MICCAKFKFLHFRHIFADCFFTSPDQNVPVPLVVASGVPASRAAAARLQRHLAVVELWPRQPPVVNIYWEECCYFEEWLFWLNPTVYLSHTHVSAPAKIILSTPAKIILHLTIRAFIVMEIIRARRLMMKYVCEQAKIFSVLHLSERTCSSSKNLFLKLRSSISVLCEINRPHAKQNLFLWQPFEHPQRKRGGPIKLAFFHRSILSFSS